MRRPTDMTRPNWRKIADDLANRLVEHAYCEQHTEPDPACPFCDDLAAYLRYVEAGGTIRKTSFGETINVSLADIPLSPAGPKP